MTTTDSPSKHDRIERHLQRQRGAGARNLTTSFGFSFGISSTFPAEPVAEPLRTIEPPAKRRKVTHEKTRDDGEGSRPRSDVSAKADGSDKQCLPNPKSASRRRIDTILEEPDPAPKIQDEDSFVKALAVKTKRGRPKKGAARDEFDPTDDVVGPPALPADSETTSEPPKKKRGRPKKTAAIGNAQVPTPRDEFVQTSMNVGQAAGLQAKKRGRPKKTASDRDVKSSISYSAAKEAGADDVSAKATSIAKVDSVRHHTEEAYCPSATANPAPRSRRRAAANAMSKVKEGFIEEELPIDRKRRDPTLNITAKRQRKTTDVAAKDSVQQSEALAVEEEESPNASSRAMKHPSTGATEHDQESDSLRVPLATTEVNVTMGSLSPAKIEPHLEKDAPKPRRRKQAPQTSVLGVGSTGRRQRKAQKLAVHLDHELARPTRSSPAKFVHGRTTARENESTIPKSQHVEPMAPRTIDGNGVRSSGEDTTRKTTASGKGSLAAHASMVADVPGLLADVNQASVRQRTLVQGASTQSDKVTARNIAGSTNRGTSKEQSAPPLNPLPRVTGGSTVSRKAEADRKLPTNDGNTEESVDWLFTAGTKKDPTLHRAPRPRRGKRPRPSLSNTPEMDLDDMLSNIASYAAEKHRCQEPLNRGCLRRR